MAYVLAQAQGWDTHGEDELMFVVAGDINGLIRAVSQGESQEQGSAASPAGKSEALTADLFMWETFTTKPYHDKGVLQRVGEFYTPWPCFVVASTHHTASHRTRDIQAMYVHRFIKGWIEIVVQRCWIGGGRGHVDMT